MSLPHPPEVSVVPAASLRRPWSISAAHVTQQTDNCCFWVGILALPAQPTCTAMASCRRSHEGANATGHLMAQQQQLCCTPATTITVVFTEALVRCSPVGGITTTIVVWMGRRHRSIAPTRNNNPASQPNHIRIAQRVNRISGRGGAERGIPDRVRGPKRQKGLSIRTHQPCPMTCSRGCLNQLAWCGFGCHPDQTRAEGTLFAIMRSAWPGGEAEAEAAGVSLRLGERQ